MRAVIQIGCGAVLIACGVVACRGGLPTKRVAPNDRPPTSVEVPGLQAGEAGRPPGAREYRIIDTESLLQIFALRGGTLARMGHNHVIASRHLRGSVMLTNDPTETRLAITIPVTLLTIDEPALRALAGPEFASEVPDTAREGTRKNLLSEALLDGDRFPGIELQCVAVESQGDGLIATIAVTVKSVTTQHRVPVNLRRDGDAAVATGQLTLRQSDVGLEPFSVMLGALAVQDELQVRFEIVARAVNP